MATLLVFLDISVDIMIPPSRLYVVFCIKLCGVVLCFMLLFYCIVIVLYPVVLH